MLRQQDLQKNIFFGGECDRANRESKRKNYTRNVEITKNMLSFLIVTEYQPF